MSALLAVVSLALFGTLVQALPPKPEGVTTLQSKFHPGISISYKEPGICETTPGVKSYAGYVHLPPNALNETHEKNSYPINTFFWFFESRKDPANAPLAIWLNGGPGGSSLMGALSENGPCFVGNDSNSTYSNPWSWNNEVNLLAPSMHETRLETLLTLPQYIDQPNQVGYSYDTPTNVTVSLHPSLFDGWQYEVADFSDGVPEHNLTRLTATTGSLNKTFTANTTDHAAVAIWHFAQTFFEEFPHYKPKDERISLFTESYGGHYGPGFVSFFVRQNELIANGTISGPGVHYLHMDTLGIVNGCIDLEEQTKSYATFPMNNTYGIKALNDTDYYRAMYELGRPNGIQDQLRICQRQLQDLDRHGYGDVESVNQYCRDAMEYAENMTAGVYLTSGKHGWYDITHPLADPFPPAYLTAYLNQQWVQRALGVPVNHTAASAAVAEAFSGTGDMAHADMVPDIAYLLDHGVKVAMLYGDRDYACNWQQGEAISLKIPWSSQKNFAAAGYAPLVISPVHSGGLTRQYGNLSFTRVYQAGHLVPSYQPEAAYEIFMRALLGKDIATGTVDLQEVAAEGEQYSTAGPRDAWWMPSEVLPVPPRECYYLEISRCSPEEQSWVFDGTAVVKDWIVIGRNESAKSQGHSVQDQIPLLGDW